MGLSEGVNRPNQCRPTLEVSQVHLDWALKEMEKLSGPQDCWEERQSSGWSGQANSDGHSSPLCFGQEMVECRPSLGLGFLEGQPIEALWVCPSYRPTKERHLKEARASFGQSPSMNWFEEQLLFGKMFDATERNENERASFADEWLMEENVRYSTPKPSGVCFLGGGGDCECVGGKVRY